MIDTSPTSPAVGPLCAGRRGSMTFLALLLVALATGVGAQGDLDFGDAPDVGIDPRWSYPTSLVDDGARHLVPASPTHFLDGAPTPFTERVSLASSGGVQGDDDSGYPSISADGRYVAFSSNATNLVRSDTNGMVDVFVHDRDTNTTTRVSVDSSGVQANHRSGGPSISADGRYVAFGSYATNLVPGDTSGDTDIFVHDRYTGATTRVSVDSSGVQGNDDSYEPSISADGRYVAFKSFARNLVPGQTNGELDIFVHDRDSDATTRVSVDSSGVQANDYSYDPSISADGRYVVFGSWASNLVPGDTNGADDVFVHDRNTRTTTLVSVNSSGVQGDDDSNEPSISADGRYVAFGSRARNLVPGGNYGNHVFVYDRDTGNTTLVSVDSSGLHANGSSYDPSISTDGRYVAFESDATNLVPGDTNGYRDVFVHDRDTGSTTRVSVIWSGLQGDRSCLDPSISADGRYVAFKSDARNLVPGDTNGAGDVFVQGENDPLDAELDGVPAPLAIGDDRNGNDDEAGVRFRCCMDPGGTARVLIDVSAAGFVNAWIDFNGDGDWGDGGEQILTDHAVSAGWNEISYSVPATSKIPRAYARVRFTSYDTAGSLGVSGQADDGEVEDYWVEGTPLFFDGFELGDTSKWSATVP